MFVVATRQPDSLSLIFLKKKPDYGFTWQFKFKVAASRLERFPFA